VDWLEKHPVVGPILAASVLHSLNSIRGYIFHRVSKKESIDIGPTYWGSRKKYRIFCVVLRTPSNDVTGYHRQQLSREDLWSHLIYVESSFFNLRHTVKLKEPDAEIEVIVTRKGCEEHNRIWLNRPG
jgi:hypothetical protein